MLVHACAHERFRKKCVHVLVGVLVGWCVVLVGVLCWLVCWLCVLVEWWVVVRGRSGDEMKAQLRLEGHQTLW